MTQVNVTTRTPAAPGEVLIAVGNVTKTFSTLEGELPVLEGACPSRSAPVRSSRCSANPGAANPHSCVASPASSHPYLAPSTTAAHHWSAPTPAPRWCPELRALAVADCSPERRARPGSEGFEIEEQRDRSCRGAGERKDEQNGGDATAYGDCEEQPCALPAGGRRPLLSERERRDGGSCTEISSPASATAPTLSTTSFVAGARRRRAPLQKRTRPIRCVAWRASWWSTWTSDANPTEGRCARIAHVTGVGSITSVTSAG